MRRWSVWMAGAGAAVVMALGAAGGGISVMAATMPTGPAPGYYTASTVGSCHGEFGDHEGVLASGTGSGFSAYAPFGDSIGQDNAVGSCPYQGVPAPVFPPG
jgi:hypothetical protein